MFSSLNTVLTVISLIEILPVSGKSEKSLNTVLTVISLILHQRKPEGGDVSQYRSHGYLFNHMEQTDSVKQQVSIPFSRLSL